jgi:hypothetical protein
MVQDLDRYPCRLCYDYVQFHGRGTHGDYAHGGRVLQHNSRACRILL